MLLGVLAAINYQLNVVGFAFIYFISSGVSLFYSILIAKRNFILPQLTINWEFWKKNIKIALNFGLISVFTTIYISIDSSMLFFIQGSEAAGFYGAAYRIVLVLLFIPSAINAAVFPAMSRLFSSSIDSLKIIVKKYFKYMLLIGIPIGVGELFLRRI